MELFPELERRYTKEPCDLREAQRMANLISFAPVVFQVTRLMRKFGILDLLRDHDGGMTLDEISKSCGKDGYTVKCLVEASLSIGSVLVDPSTDRFRLSNMGWFLLTDAAVGVNFDFNHDVNYEGLFHLEESFERGKPVGLKHFGDWPTIYEGLSSLPEQVQRSWFGFDHFYSDHAFAKALETVFARPVRNLLDVGGNTGKWARQCVAYSPDVRVTILDLPQQIALMRQACKDAPGAERIDGYGMDILNPDLPFPTDKKYDAIWMSQFLDCFSEGEILGILTRAEAIMDGDSRLYIMECLWNRQKYEPAAMCLTLTSIYFTAMANGNSKMYSSEDMLSMIDRAGLETERIVDGVGHGHNILICRKRA